MPVCCLQSLLPFCRCFNPAACLGSAALNETTTFHRRRLLAAPVNGTDYKTSQCGAPYQGNLCGESLAAPVGSAANLHHAGSQRGSLGPLLLTAMQLGNGLLCFMAALVGRAKSCTRAVFDLAAGSAAPQGLSRCRPVCWHSTLSAAVYATTCAATYLCCCFVCAAHAALPQVTASPVLARYGGRMSG